MTVEATKKPDFVRADGKPIQRKYVPHKKPGQLPDDLPKKEAPKAQPMEISEQYAQADAYMRIVAATKEVDEARERMVVAGKAAAAAKQAYTKAMENQMNMVRSSTMKLPLIDLMEKQVLIDKLLAMPRYAAQWAVNLLFDKQDIPGLATGDDSTAKSLCQNWQQLAAHFGLPTDKPGEEVRYWDGHAWKTATIAPENVGGGNEWYARRYLNNVVDGQVFAQGISYGDSIKIGNVTVEVKRPDWPDLELITLDQYIAACRLSPVAMIVLVDTHKTLGEAVLVRWDDFLERLETLDGKMVHVIKEVDDDDDEEGEDSQKNESDEESEVEE